MILFHFMVNLTSGLLGLADGVRPWLFGVLALAAIAVVAWFGLRTRQRWGAAGIIVATILSVMTVPRSAATQTVLAELQVEVYPRSSMAAALGDGPATEASVRVLRGSAVIPFVYRSGRTLLASSLSGSWVAVKVRPLDPARDEPLKALYDFDLNLMALQQVSERWRLALVVSPGIASDLRKLAADHWTLQGAVLATRQASPSLEWGFGVSATNAFGAFGVVPVASLAWVGSRARADLLLPARASVLWTPSSRVEAGIAAQLSGNAYGLSADEELRDAVVRYSVVNAGPAVHLYLTPGLRLSFSGGASLRRRLEIEAIDGNTIQDARLRGGWTFRAGIAWLLPA